MQLIVTNKSLVEKLQKLKIEAISKSDSILVILEEFLRELKLDDIDSAARKARINNVLERLKFLKKTNLAFKLKKLVFATKYLKHLRNFFSYSSCTNNCVTIRRILIKLLKNSPEEEPAIYLLCNLNSFSNNKNNIYAYKIFGDYR